VSRGRRRQKALDWGRVAEAKPGPAIASELGQLYDVEIEDYRSIRNATHEQHQRLHSSAALAASHLQCRAHRLIGRVHFPLVRLSTSHHFPTPAASEVALPHHASRLVAGSSAPDIALPGNPHHLARRLALPPCTMLGFARSTTPPTMPVAARRPVRLPQLLDFAEPAEGKRPKGRARGDSRGD